MDGNKNTLRRVALPAFALGILALPLAGAGAQDAAGQRAMVAEIAQTESQSLTDEIVPANAAATDFDASFARFDIDPPAPSVGTAAVDIDSFEPPVEAEPKTLPFGTKVRVTNPRTGKSVIVRINDRGPYAHGREIDVSRAAAVELGLVQRGHGTVELALVD